MGNAVQQIVISKMTLLLFYGVIFVAIVVHCRLPESRSHRGHHEKPPPEGGTMSDMVAFLSDYGYVDEVAYGGVAHLQTAEELSEAIRLVQRVAHLRETGILDAATAEYIARPRCGVTDRNLVEKLKHKDQLSSRRYRMRRYTISGYGKWEKNILTWTLKRSTPQLSEATTLREIQRAFKVWSDGSGLQFRRVGSNDRADIEIDFFRRRHYDKNSFDGEGGVLAHAFYPITSYSGDLHFDDDEHWMSHEDAKNVEHGKSVSLFYVAAHELGHSLGLDHSNDDESLMMASYPGPKDIPSLPHDDLMAIQYLYGPNNEGNRDERPPVMFTTSPRPAVPRTTTRSRTYRPETTRTSTPRRTPAPVPTRPTSVDVCPMTFDTIASVRGEIFLFKDQNMWRINSRDEVSGPSLTSAFWHGLPVDLDGVDAVYERQTRGSNIMFFSGQKYWLFDGNTMLPGYPRPLTDLGLPSNLKRLDATLVWGQNGQTYFFAQNLYWRFNETIERVDADYPREITAWHGVPADLTSALRWKGGSTYFFKGKVFWQFDNTKMAVEHNAGRLSVPYWIECLGKAHDPDGNNDNSVYQTSFDSLKKGALNVGRSSMRYNHLFVIVSSFLIIGVIF